VEELDFSWKYKMIQPCDDKSMPPTPDVYLLILGSCEYVTLCEKRALRM
jgi:hypothetical protein